MKRRWFILYVFLIGLALLILWTSGATQPASAQRRQPTPIPGKSPTRLPDSVRPTLPTPTPKKLPGARVPKATGGPDDFGYTWDDAVAFSWIDATTGTDSGLVGDDASAGPFAIGFDFKFYENTYSQVYLNSNGLLTFGGGAAQFSNAAIPRLAAPNNFIAPFWEDLAVGSPYNNGKVYYASGGTAPNRYLVAEWHEVTRVAPRDGSAQTFEIVLYENGDIVTQYLSVTGNLQSATVGIEDDLGIAGLQYLYNTTGLANNKAVRFTRPAAAARVKAWSLSQGLFTRANELLAYQISIRNTGDLGADTFDFTHVSPWTLSLYAADGVTPLTDTNGNGFVDTDSVAQGSTVTITAKVQTPATVNVGDANIAALTVISWLDAAVSQIANLRASVPAPFAQVYRNGDDNAMSFYFVQPTAQTLKKVTADNYNGSDPAVARMPNGGFVYTWQKERCLVGNPCTRWVNEIEYALLDRAGSLAGAVTKLTDHSGATMHTRDYNPTVAVAPNGNIGVLWYRQLMNVSGQLNYNIYFAILDAVGNIVLAPTDVTNNTTWGTSSDLNVPILWVPRIAATGDNRFVLAWQRYHRQSDSEAYNIWYSVRDTSGTIVKDVTQFTSDGASFFHSANAVSGNRAILTWLRSWNIYYAVLDSAGGTVKTETNLTNNGQGRWSSDAAALSDGKTAVAWIDYDGTFAAKDQLAFAILDASYNRAAGPTSVYNSTALTGNSNVSVAADAASRAILTWMDADSNDYRNLYYALVNSRGTALASPMIFRSSQTFPPYMQTSTVGYGNTSNTDADLWVQVPASVSAPPGGVGAIAAQYGNKSAVTATSVVLTATLGSGLTYANANPSPNLQVGNTVTWNLPDLTPSGSGQVTLWVSVPNAAYGTRYTVDWVVTCAVEDNPSDDTATGDVVIAAQIHLPLIIR